MRQIAIYEGYSERDELIQWFWDIMKNEFDINQKKRLLLFTTGSDRIPIGGIKEMTFKITRIEAINQYALELCFLLKISSFFYNFLFKKRLPMSHTCFNQLILPNYKKRDILKSKLLVAIENAEGFGIK